MDTDLLLIQKMRMGDEQATEYFVKKYYPAILRYCLIHIGDHGYAEDLTQETFVRFFGTLGQYRHYGKAANYLYAIAANLCRDYHKKHRELPVEEMPEQRNLHMPEIDDRLDLQIAFSGLPDELFEVAVLYFLQERRQKDIAQILGIGVPLVKYRIRRARALIEAYFRDD